MAPLPRLWLAGLAMLTPLVSSVPDVEISSDRFFFGQSPGVYPSPDLSPSPEWAASYAKAKALVARMTLEEKVSLTGGAEATTGCSGMIAPIPRLDFPGICLSDAGNGLRGTDFVNAYPAGIHVGASWNKELAQRRGRALGGEFRRKGVNVLLGPVVGPLGRIVAGGRNWEGFSVDPYLAGALAAQTVMGVQSQGVQTSLKHFIANEQETTRKPTAAVESVSSNIDDKTMHEVYLAPFQDGIRAGTSNIMCSYQRINNSYGCANSKTLNGLLKTELMFQGFVVSDWEAQHSGVASALAGLDMAMPTPGKFWGEFLVEAVRNESVPESRVTDMAIRILTPWYHLGQDKAFRHPGFGMPLDVLEPHEPVQGLDEKDRPTLLEGAIEGHVLVKNTKETLPLRSPRAISLFGYSARSPDMFGPSDDTIRSYMWTGGEQALGEKQAVDGFGGEGQAIAPNGTLMGGGGSAAATPAVFVAPYDALSMRAAQDDTALYHDFGSAEPSVMASSEACVVFGNAWAAEGGDRPGLSDNYTDTLVLKVADQCNKTIVVLHNAGPRLVDGFVAHPNVTAILFAHLPGRDSGTALVKLLYGEVSPSGKLCYTVAKRAADYGHLVAPDVPASPFHNFPQSSFHEGVYLDYKHFEQKDIVPRYEFGFGLSYTTFALAKLKLGLKDWQFSEFPLLGTVPGGPGDLFHTIATASVELRNTGSMAGAEVVQLYVGIPRGPAKQLRGFEKVFLRPGEATTVEFALTRRDLSTWDVVSQRWWLWGGEYSVYVGTSSRTLPLSGKLNINEGVESVHDRVGSAHLDLDDVPPSEGKSRDGDEDVSDEELAGPRRLIPHLSGLFGNGPEGNPPWGG